MTDPERTALHAPELLPNERALIEHVQRGDELELTVGEAGDESRTVHAWVIRDILRGRLADGPDPHGLRLRGGRIVGRLDLENLTSTIPLALTDCLLPEGVIARDAHLASLTFTGCLLEHPTEPPLDADRLTTGRLVLDHVTITGAATCGVVTVRHTHLAALHCLGAHITNTAGSALDVTGANVDQDVLLHDGFTAAALVPKGTSDPHSDIPCAVRLRGARIGGDLDCTNATMSNLDGPALEASSVQVDQNVFLREGFSATGAGTYGAVALRGARIGGDLDCTNATMSNLDGPALEASSVQVDQNVFLREGFSATGAGTYGAARLPDARIGGDLDCTNATTSNLDGPALAADSVQVDGNVFLSEGFSATGAGTYGAARLIGARIGGDLQCDNATMTSQGGPVFVGYGLNVHQSLYLVSRFAAKNGDDVTIHIQHGQVGGVLTFTPTAPEAGDSPLRIALDGLTYAGLPHGIHATKWLEMLRTSTTEYTAQPYQQLAAAHRAAGHDREARRVLIAQRRDQLHRATPTGPAERAWARIIDVTLAYGYQPWRALLFLVAIVLIAIALATTLGAAGGLAATSATSSATTPPLSSPCNFVDRIGVGLALGAPLITTSASTHCDTTNTLPGHTLVITGWVLQALAWTFATLFIAGFTGVVRKT